VPKEREGLFLLEFAIEWDEGVPIPPVILPVFKCNPTPLDEDTLVVSKYFKFF
jgi:hypothetical protein